MIKRGPNWRKGNDPESKALDRAEYRAYLKRLQAEGVKEDSSILIGNRSQRAMLATYFVCEETHGNRERLIGGTKFTQRIAAKIFNVNKCSVSMAKTLLQKGTKEEIQAAESGKESIFVVAKEIISGVDAKQRAKRRETPLIARGNNQERIQRAGIEGRIWTHMREVLTNLTGLPKASDVVSMILANDKKTAFVDHDLSISLQWLKEFSDEWWKRRADEKDRTKNGDRDDLPRPRSRAA